MEEEKREIAVVVTLDGVFGFIGTINDERSNEKVLALDDALTVAYETDGTPYPTFGQLPVGAANPMKHLRTMIPTNNISYVVTLDDDNEHSIVDKYHEFFSRDYSEIVGD